MSTPSTPERVPDPSDGAPLAWHQQRGASGPQGAGQQPPQQGPFRMLSEAIPGQAPAAPRADAWATTSTSFDQVLTGAVSAESTKPTNKSTGPAEGPAPGATGGPGAPPARERRPSRTRRGPAQGFRGSSQAPEHAPVQAAQTPEEPNAAAVHGTWVDRAYARSWGSSGESWDPQRGGPTTYGRAGQGSGAWQEGPAAAPAAPPAGAGGSFPGAPDGAVTTPVAAPPPGLPIPADPGGSQDPRRTGAPDAPDPASSAGSPARSAGSARSAEPAPVTGPQKVLGAALGRRPRGFVAFLLVAVVVVAMVAVPLAVYNLGLGGQDGGRSAGAAETVLAGDAELDSVVEIAGRQGTVPVVSLKGVLSAPGSLVTDVLIQGSGRKVTEGGPVMLSVSTFSGIDGSNTTGTDSGTHLYVGKLDEGMGRDMDSVLQGRTEGSRVVLRAPKQEQDGTRTTEITVVDVLPTTATGQERSPAEGMPVVTPGKGGTMSVSVKDVPAPTRAAITTLVQGTGPQVGASDRVVARYSIVSWSTGKEATETTYGDDVVPRVIDMTNTYAGISQLLTDITVGSRVVLALPPELARGEDAVAVVVDVLAIRAGGESGEDAVTETGPTGASEPTGTAAPSAPQAQEDQGQDG